MEIIACDYIKKILESNKWVRVWFSQNILVNASSNSIKDRENSEKGNNN